MKFARLIISLLLLVSLTKTYAQDFELGKVSKAELEEKFHPTDTTTAAAILYKKAKTYYVFQSGHGFIVNHENTIRIKIYKKEGLKWANFQAHYYTENIYTEADILKFSNCVTYNLENDAIVTTPLQNEGSFKTNVNKYFNEASITMPNVKVGSVIEIKYILKSEHNVRFPVFNFQYEIPVNYAEYLTDIPEMYIYKPILTGYVKVNTDIKLLDANKSYSFKYNQYNDIIFKYIQCIYTAENIPALKEEIHIDNIRNYRSSIQHELERTRFPNEAVKDFSITWEGVAKNIFDYSDFGRELKKQNYFDQDLKSILENTKTDQEKVESIFKFVQTKMNWNQDNDIFADKGVKQAYIDGTGNTAEINFILIAMLNSAGIKTDPVLISTVEHGVPVYPNRTVFNSVLAAAQVDGKQVLLDATTKYSTINTLPLEDLNWTGRLIKKDGTSQEVNLVPELQSKENTNLLVIIDDKGKIAGRTRIKKTDYEAYNFREKNAVMNAESYLEKLETNLNGIQINDYTIDNVKDLSQPIIENFTFTSENQLDIIEGKIYVNPLLFFTQNRNPFVQEKRQMPIYFAYPKQDKFNITIEIPEGYVVESFPKPVKITTGDNVGLFSFNISTEGNKVQIQVTSEINKAMISADYYDILKNFFQQMIDKQNEKIVLKKI